MNPNHKKLVGIFTSQTMFQRLTNFSNLKQISSYEKALASYEKYCCTYAHLYFMFYFYYLFCLLYFDIREEWNFLWVDCPYKCFKTCISEQNILDYTLLFSQIFVVLLNAFLNKFFPISLHLFILLTLSFISCCFHLKYFCKS